MYLTLRDQGVGYLGLCTELNRGGILQSGRVIYLFICAPTGHGLFFSCPVPRSGFVRGKKMLTRSLTRLLPDYCRLSHINSCWQLEFHILYYFTLNIDIMYTKRILFWGCWGTPRPAQTAKCTMFRDYLHRLRGYSHTMRVNPHKGMHLVKYVPRVSEIHTPL